MVPLAIMIVAVGVWFVVSALANWEWFYGIMEFAALEALFGEGVSRIVCLLLGVGMILGGIAACCV